MIARLEKSMVTQNYLTEKERRNLMGILDLITEKTKIKKIFSHLVCQVADRRFIKQPVGVSLFEDWDNYRV